MAARAGRLHVGAHRTVRRGGDDHRRFGRAVGVAVAKSFVAVGSQWRGGSGRGDGQLQPVVIGHGSDAATAATDRKLPQLLLALEDARARKDLSEECDLLLDLARRTRMRRTIRARSKTWTPVCTRAASTSTSRFRTGAPRSGVCALAGKAARLGGAIVRGGAATGKTQQPALMLLGAGSAVGRGRCRGSCRKRFACLEKAADADGRKDEVQVRALLQLGDCTRRRAVAKQCQRPEQRWRRRIGPSKSRDESLVPPRMARAALQLNPRQVIALLTPA